jgi:hypothetical protein
MDVESDLTRFWTTKKLVLIGGLGASAAAAMLAWRREEDLRARVSQLQALPAGSVDEWNRQHSEAEEVLADRDFWSAVAVGVGSVTAVYAITSRSLKLGAGRPVPGSFAAPRKPKWDVRINPFRPRVSIERSF